MIFMNSMTVSKILKLEKSLRMWYKNIRPVKANTTEMKLFNLNDCTDCIFKIIYHNNIKS